MNVLTRPRHKESGNPRRPPAREAAARAHAAPPQANGRGRFRITIVNDAPLSFNPRSVKEADALEEQGHTVRVVSVGKSARLSAATARLTAEREWEYQAVNYDPTNLKGFLRWAFSGSTQRGFKFLSRYRFEFGLAERALCRYRRAFLKAAVSAPTDMYIAHNLTSLPVAAAAAKIKGVPLGFDIEDYHMDEESSSPGSQFRRSLKSYLMRKYVPVCSYLSATSNVMADAVAEELGVARPEVIYNVFPLSQAAGVLPPALRPSRDDKEPLTAYWFSHVVGLDRGLQDFIRAMPLMKRRVDLYLRGQVGEGTKGALLALADEVGVRERVFFLRVIDADDLIGDAARFDFGLALEQPISRNKELTVSNKLFTYLLAGIVPVATATPGQCEIMSQVEVGGALYRPGEVEELAERMNRLVVSPQLIMKVKQNAWDAARSRFCWDIEKQRLLAAVESVLSSAGSRRV